MAEFVETSIGWVNLDHVMMIRTGDDGAWMQFTDGRTVLCQIISTTPRELPGIINAETDVGPGGDYSAPTIMRGPAATPPAPAAETDVGV